MNRLKDNKKIAVIGGGHWGKNLIRNFYQSNNLYAVCDSDPQALAKYKDLHVAHAVTDYAQLLKQEEIDAVAIATPAESHYEIVRASLIAGKDVLVEKPLALNVNQARDLGLLAEQKGLVLMVDHLLQYHPAIVKLKDFIDTGRLGNLQYIYSNRLNIGKLRKEENILWSFAPHDISVILHLVGQVPQKVRAFGEAYLQKNVYDTTITDLTFNESLKSHIFVSWLHPFKEQKLVVIGDKNMAVFDDMAEDKLVLYPHKVEWVNQVPIASKAKGEIVSIQDKEPLKEACLHFLDCIENRTTPRTDAQEAITVLEVLQQAEENLDAQNNVSQKRFIDVPS